MALVLTPNKVGQLVKSASLSNNDALIGAFVDILLGQRFQKRLLMGDFKSQLKCLKLRRVTQISANSLKFYIFLFFRFLVKQLLNHLSS